MSSPCLHEVKLEVSFPDSRYAEIAANTLSVDKEPRRGGCTKEVTHSDNVLSVVFHAQEARHLRVGVNSFMEFLQLVTETMEKFGPPV